MSSAYADLTFSEITSDKVALLRDYLKRNGAAVVDGNAGTATNECFSAQYDWNPSSGILKITPLKLVPSLTPKRLTQLVDAIVTPRSTAQMFATTTIYKPTPHACATYNWAIGFFTNKTNMKLSYSSNSTNNGNFTSPVNDILPGVTPADHQDGFWQNQGPKDNTQAVAGSVTYIFPDGSTTITIFYSVNTLSAATCSVGKAGQNAARYKVTCEQQTAFDFAAAFLYPYITIDYDT